jgi:hypothetical protein
MFFRGRQPETSIWRRFRSGLDGFTFVKEDGYYAAHVVANAERIVDLFYVLAEHLPPAVDVTIDDLRGAQSWRGERIALPDVQDAIGRLKVPLAATGGVEFAVFSADDQLTLNPRLELFIYARSDRWYYLLTGMGLEERRSVATKSWKLVRQHYDPAPELSGALVSAASRLGLTAVSAS